MRSCGRFGPASEGTTVARSSDKRIRIHRLRRAIHAEQSLRLRVRLHQLDQLRRRDSSCADNRATRRRSETRRWSRHTPAPCSRWSRDPPRSARPIRRRKIRRTSRPRPFSAASASRTKPGRSPSRPRQLAVQLEPDHRRQQHRRRLPQHASLRLNSAHAPPDHAQPVDHGRVRIGARPAYPDTPAPFALNTTGARYSRFT